ncbi:MAG TPA: hypothetical protein VGJ20_20565 [Xanthobacteraceae bacterium]|jgi:hypothetical protein
MSDIPRARELLQEVEHMTDLLQIRRQVARALPLMIRERPSRHAPGRPTIITPATRKYIHKLARTDHTIHEIANLTGIRNNGRISEVLTGKR